MRLDVDERDLASCVACGLCLPHCPTFRVTGKEAESPRGRIAAMRAAHADPGPPTTELTEILDHCVQCRGCEEACPSGVPFGRLMEGARHTLARATRYQPWHRRAGYWVLGHHRVLLAASSGLALAQRLNLVPSRYPLPRLALWRDTLPRDSREPPDAWLFPGCVMDAWMRPVHNAAIRVMTAAGARVGVPRSRAGCCGALHVHAGLREQAVRLARATMPSMPGEAPVVVDSAGCGAHMAEYGELLGTSDAAAFADRVTDVSEWLAGRLDRLPEPARRVEAAVAVQDPCHLRHVSRSHMHVRSVLAPFADLVELDDDGLCCGAGGVYSVTYPEMSRAIRDVKVEAVRRSKAGIVASANPGCMMTLSAAGVRARHPVEILDWALGGQGSL